MKLLRYLLPLAMATCGFAATLTAGDYSTITEERERDPSAVADYLKSKRAVTLAEKGGNLGISGEVDAEWDHIKTHSDGKRLRGSGSQKHVRSAPFIPWATNEFSVEVNLMFDYRTDKTWAAIQFQFDNPAGIKKIANEDKHFGLNAKPRLKHVKERNVLFGSGVLDNIVMRKAYMGLNVLDHGTSRLDIEVGRRRGYDVFDSKVQFENYMDGLLLKYANSFEGVFDLTAKAEAFVVDYRVNQFGYVGEIGFLNIADAGFDLKYSIIDWDTHKGKNRWGHKHARGSEFITSQYTAAYHISPDMIRFPTTIYGAFLHNSRARHNHFSHHEKAANAWYAGAKVGEVRKKGDWSVEADYQWVQAQAMPESDVSGIGRDNPNKISFYDSRDGRSGGWANYKGWEVDGFYALTDNLTLNAYYDHIREVNHKIGGKYRSWTFTLAAIYAF